MIGEDNEASLCLLEASRRASSSSSDTSDLKKDLKTELCSGCRIEGEGSGGGDESDLVSTELLITSTSSSAFIFEGPLSPFGPSMSSIALSNTASDGLAQPLMLASTSAAAAAVAAADSSVWSS